jgi:hypothetical protein
MTWKIQIEGEIRKKIKSDEKQIKKCRVLD